MTGHKRVILALCRVRKSAQATEFTVCMELPPTPGQQFMPVSLMTYVPYNTVIRCILDVVQGYGQFHCSEAGSEVPRIAGEFFNNVLP